MISSDKIFIRNLRQEILIGINPEEKIHRQEVIVNVTLETDCAVAGKSDDISDALDYSVIHDQIVEHMQNTHYDLIETLAEKIAQLCLSYDQLTSCTVAIDKPQALQFADSVAVEITRVKK